jgi:hypothetical protein
MSMNATDTNIAVTPTFAITTAHEAVARVNRWLHRDLGTAVHAASATFDPATFCRTDNLHLTVCDIVMRDYKI